MYELAIVLLHNRFSIFPPIVRDRLSVGCGRLVLQLPSKCLSSRRKPTYVPHGSDIFAIAIAMPCISAV